MENNQEWTWVDGWIDNTAATEHNPYAPGRYNYRWSVWEEDRQGCALNPWTHQTLTAYTH